MGIEVKFNAANFERTKARGYDGRSREVEQQTIWVQIGVDQFVEALVRRPVAGFQRAAYIVEATLRTGLRSTGAWNESRHYEPSRLFLVEDPAAVASSAPTPPEAHINEGLAYYNARTEYALPGEKDRKSAT